MARDARQDDLRFRWNNAVLSDSTRMIPNLVPLLTTADVNGFLSNPGNFNTCTQANHTLMYRIIYAFTCNPDCVMHSCPDVPEHKRDILTIGVTLLQLAFEMGASPGFIKFGLERCSLELTFASSKINYITDGIIDQYSCQLFADDSHPDDISAALIRIVL